MVGYAWSRRVRCRGSRSDRTGRSSSRPCGPGSRSIRSRVPAPIAANGRENPAIPCESRQSGRLPPMVNSTTRGPWRPNDGSSLSARARISVPKNDPELWPTSTISSASLLRAMLSEVPCKTVDALVPLRTPSMRELPGPDRVRQEIEHVSVVLGVFQHGAEHGHEDRGCRGNTEEIGDADRTKPLSNTNATAAAHNASSSSTTCG